MQKGMMESTYVDYRPETVEAVQQQMLAALETGAPRVVLMLDHLDRLDTEAVKGLIVLLRRAREAGGEIALQVSRPELLRSLKVTALDRLFPLIGVAA
jgi:anti-anti-sigma factor